MESAPTGWWRRHGVTGLLLLTAFGLTFLIRSLFVYQILHQWGPLYVYGGGSDSFYHSRVMTWIIQNHTNLVRDPALKYPLGAINPREPLFDWMNALLGIVFAPFFGGNAVAAGAFFLDLQGPLWAALSVFPIYLIGKEVSNRRMGIIAAFLFPLLVANIDSSILGYANYLSFYTFFILLVVLGYLRTVKLAGTRRWVVSYRRPREIPAALRAFLRTERTAVKWAVFTGVAFGALALAWQGYTFAVALIVIFLVFAMVVERIRRIDSFGLYVLTWIVGLIGFPLAMPYFLAQQQFAGWFDLPLLIFFGALLVLLPFLFLRDTPWVISIPVLIATAAGAILALYFGDPAAFMNIVSGQGYFSKTLIYTTVAEAQAPSIDALILGYGVVTFFLAFVGLAVFLYRLVRQRFPRALMLFVAFAVMSIYLPVSAAKFFYVGSAAFALLPAEVLLLALDVGGYHTLRRNVASLSDRRSQFVAFRRSLKARHILVLLLLLVILLPNVWYSVDAGIPYNEKSQYSQQIYNSIPAPLRLNSSSYYLGAAGTQLDTPNQYDESGYDWLATQDTNLPESQRPAFISWWDYGFQAIAEGKHPSVADNFQNGIDPAGNFLLSQNESQAIAILATTLLQGEQVRSHQPYLPASLNQIIARDGVNVTELHQLLVNTSADVPLVIAHPDRYLPVDPSHLDPQNAMYLTMAYFLATSLPTSGVAALYNDLQTYTGWSIRYTMTDSRLIPFSGTNTGIFYAPADLTDRVIGPGGAPTAFYNLSVVGSDGNTYPLGQLPAGVTAVNYNINYQPAFYRTMIYRTFFGFNGTDIGQGAGIPGVSLSQQPEPGWMLQHFMVAYKTAYYCPFSNPAGHPNCFVAMNLPEAQALQKKQNGTLITSLGQVEQLGGEESMLEYYPGLPLTGVVSLPDGTPVSHARVTVYDGWHIPHESVFTGSDGSYRVDLPPGPDTVNVTSGLLSGLSQSGTTQIASLSYNVPDALALDPASPVMYQNIVLRPGSIQGFVYWNTANNSSFQPHTDALVPGATLVFWGQGIHPLETTSDISGAFSLANVPPGVYNFSVLVNGENFTQNLVYVNQGQAVNQTTGLSAGSLLGHVTLSNGAPVPGASVSVTGARGPVGTVVANASGGYKITNLGPGTYTLVARVPSAQLGSPAATANLTSPGQKVTQNLTVVPVVPIQLLVLDNGAPVPSFPVRFTPIVAPPPLPSPTRTSPTPVTQANQNSTLFMTGADGYVRASIPVGNYSVYGLGFAGGSMATGFTNAYLHPSPTAVFLPPLVLGPALRLSGTATLPTGSSALTAPIPITAFGPVGEQVTAYANGSGHWAMLLPAGTYSIVAQVGLPPSRAAPYGAMASVTLSGPTTLDLPLAGGELVRTVVGTPTQAGPPGHSLFPVVAARVAATLEPVGATLTSISNATGNTTYVVPASLPPGESYCLNVSALGFAPYAKCGLTPSELAASTPVALALIPVPVHVHLVNFPTGVAVHLNFTASGPPAATVTAVGGPDFTLSVLPGNYVVTAWAPSPTGKGLYLPPIPLNSTIDLGASSANATLTLLHQFPAVGSLLLPAHGNASLAHVRLSSPSMNVTLTGTRFTSHFFVAPGAYTAYAYLGAGNATFVTLLPISVNASGGLSSAIPLTAPGGYLTANLTQPDGTLANATAPITFVSPQNLSVTTDAVGGQLRLPLPANVSFTPLFNTTTLATVGGVTAYVTWTPAAGDRCEVTRPSSTCTIPVAQLLYRASVAGTITYGGAPSTFSGSVTLVGPSPSDALQTLSISGGRFAGPLVPGVYSVYASAGGAGSLFANVSQLTIPYAPSYNVSVDVGRAWTDTLTVEPPPGGSTGPALVTWTSATGVRLVFANQPVGVPVGYPLPVGTWTVTANGTGTAYGRPANATGSASVTLANGNAATQVALVPILVPAVALGAATPGAVTVSGPAGGVAEFGFTVRNTGDEPVTVSFTGAPATWRFAFTPSNVTLTTLGPGASAGIRVVVTVPAGTPVNHPPFSIQAAQVGGRGQTVGSVSPAAAVAVTPFFGVATGPLPGEASVGPLQATLPFWVANTGNSPETVSVGVSDLVRLEGLGWAVEVARANTPQTTPLFLGPAINTTLQVKLSAPNGIALSPGTVSLLATVTNASGRSTATTTLTVPVATVSVQNSTLTVVGPSIGSPPAYPDWLVPVLVFVPAAAFLGGMLGWRWYRTRRWVRR